MSVINKILEQSGLVVAMPNHGMAIERFVALLIQEFAVSVNERVAEAFGVHYNIGTELIKEMIDFEMSAPSKEELMVKLEEYREKYDPRGYGTTIFVPQQYGGKWIARIVRSESCD